MEKKKQQQSYENYVRQKTPVHNLPVNIDILQGTSMYPTGGKGRMYTYRIGPDPDGGRSRGITGAEKRTGLSSGNIESQWMDGRRRKSR